MLHGRASIIRKVNGPRIYIIITKNICYLLWNQGLWRSLNNTYPIFLTPCIRCTNHLCDSCDLTDVNPHFIPWLLRMIPNVDLLWRHRAGRQQNGCYGRFLSTMLLRTVILICDPVFQQVALLILLNIIFLVSKRKYIDTFNWDGWKRLLWLWVYYATSLASVCEWLIVNGCINPTKSIAAEECNTRTSKVTTFMTDQCANIIY